MADIFNIAGRIHSTSNEKVATTADEILDSAKGKKQDVINLETDNRLQEAEADINTPSQGIKDRLSTLENQVAFEGEIQVENTPEGISSTNAKVTTANAVRGAIDVRTGYFTCDTAAATAAKTVTANGFLLTNGGSVKVKMTNANSATSPTLNINGTGAKTLYYDGEAASPTNTWEAGEVLDLYYDSTNARWMANNASGGGKFSTGEKVKSVGIDSELTSGSENLAKSGVVEKNLYNSIGSIFAINSFCGLRVSNFNTGKISKAGIVDDVSVNGICIPVNAGDVYKFEDITLWHPNTSIGKQVKVYNEYPTISNSTDTCVGSVAVFNGKFTMPSGAKYMVVTCAVSECGNNMRIIQVHDDEELAKIKEWILSESYTVESVTRDSDGNVSSANVTFPDGVTGSISLTRNSDGDATVENVVYGSDTYRLTITRNSNGDVTATSLTKI